MALPLIAAIPALGKIPVIILLIVGPIVYKVLSALGVGFVTYSLANLGTDALLEYVQQKTVGLPFDMLAMVGLLRLDDAIALISSAYGARAALAGWRFYEGRYNRRTQVWNRLDKDGNLPA